MKKTLLVLLLATPVLLLWGAANAQDIPYSVVANGSDEQSSSSYVILATVGQGCVGDLQSASYLNEVGYWLFPGPNIGEPTRAYLSLFDARRQGAQVIVRWEVAGAVASDGFHVWRQEPGQERTRLSQAPVSGPSGFEFVDPSAPAGEVEYWLQEVRGEAYHAWYGPVSVSALPLIYRLEENWPNPFNPMTQLRFSLPEAERVRLSIYDVRGRLIRTLVDGPQPSGLYTVPWDGRDERGVEVASGVYFTKLESAAGVQTRKMLLAR